MGKIQRYRANPVKSSVIASNISQAGQIGRSVAQFGQTISAVAREKDNIQANNFVTDAAISLETELGGAFNQWQQDNKEAPVGATKKLDEYLKPIYETYEQKAPNDTAKQRLKGLLNSQSRRYTRQALSWENKTLIDNTAQVTQKGIESSALNAYNAGNTDAINQNLANLEGVLSNTKKVFNNNDYLKAQAAGRAKVVTEGVQGMIDQGNFSEAEQLLNSGAYDEALGVDNKQKLNAVLQRRKASKLKQQSDALNNKFKKPWSYLEDMGELQNAKPLDFIQNVETSFQNRMDYVLEMESKHRMDVPFLNENELAQFESNFNKVDVKQQDMMMANISRQLPDEVISRVGAQLFKKDPESAVAFSLYGEAPDVSRELLQGREIVKNKNYQIPSKDFDVNVNKKIGEAFPIERQDELMQVRKAITALYTKRATESNIDPASIDEDILEASTKDIIGPEVVINDRQTLSFRDKNGTFIDEGDFEDIVEDLTNERIKHVTGQELRRANGEKLDWNEVKDDAYLKPVGDGIYIVQLSDNSGTYFVQNQDGKPFELNLKEITNVFGRSPTFFQEVFSDSN